MSEKSVQSRTKPRKLGVWEGRRLSLRIAIRNELEVARAGLNSGRSEGYVLANVLSNLNSALTLEEANDLLTARVVDTESWTGPKSKQRVQERVP